MANIKQQIKRNKRSLKQHERNLRYRSTMKTLFRRVDEAFTAGDTEAAEARAAELEKLVDKAADKGVIHRNTAARRKSRLARLKERHKDTAAA